MSEIRTSQPVCYVVNEGQVAEMLILGTVIVARRGCPGQLKSLSNWSPSVRILTCYSIVKIKKYWLNNRHLIFSKARHLEVSFPEWVPWLSNLIKGSISFLSSILPPQYVGICLQACHLMVAGWPGKL